MEWASLEGISSAFHWYREHVKVRALTLPNLPVAGYFFVLLCQPMGQRRLRPKQSWDSKLEMYCRYEGLGHWENIWVVLLSFAASEPATCYVF